MKVKEILGDSSIWMPGKDYEMADPYVSVLLPTFRRAESGYFEKAVDSVLNQTLKNIELIIIDDCSSDGTFDLIKYYMKIDSRVSCIRHNYNIGLPAISEYEGYMKAKANYIAFIFDDCEWDSQYLHKTLLYMNKHNVKATYGIVHSYYGYRVNDFITLGMLDEFKSIDDIVTTNFIANGGVILHKEVIEKVGLYDPHLTLTRLCDWDLWRRIIRYYKFDCTYIYAGIENGAKLKDSLGNTVSMNSWVSLEQICRERSEELRPNNFLEYDIHKIYTNTTSLFLGSLNEFATGYSNKRWYKKQNLIKNNDSREMKRVLLLFNNTVNATITLSFLRLLYHTDNLIIRFGSSHDNDLAMTDIVVIIRDIPLFEKQLKKCKELNIPCYYYIDDNFITLESELKDNEEVSKIAQSITVEKLSQFKGIFVSSNELYNFLKEDNLHSNIIEFKPIFDTKQFNKNKMSTVSADNKVINIAFMGGDFRMNIFKRIVLPAILKVSETYNINLYYPIGKNEEIIEDLNNKGLKLFPVKRCFSLDSILREYNKNIDILVHCGPDIKNNKYKTRNSLINATTLGAVLLASNNEPYRENNNQYSIFYTAENTVKDWCEKLFELSSNTELRKEIVYNAYNYCVEEYSGNIVFDPIINEFYKNESLNTINGIQRYEKLYIDLLEMYYRGDRNIIKTSRSLVEVPICLSRLIKKSTSYKIKCTVDSLAQVGFTMTSFGNCSGKVDIEIIHKNKCIRRGLLYLDKIDKDNWNYINFKPISNSSDKIYTIKLKFSYEPGSTLVGVFEDMTNRRFIYKVANKFKIHLKGMNTIFVDCRSEGDRIDIF